MSIEKLTEIARTRYETGAYGATHFALAPDLREHLFATYPASERAPWDPLAGVGRLMEIPVVVDETLSTGAWELRANDDHRVLLSGEVEQLARDYGAVVCAVPVIFDGRGWEARARDEEDA